jgi:hypothetical protein
MGTRRSRTDIRGVEKSKKQKKQFFKNNYEMLHKSTLWKAGQITATTAMKHLNIKPNTFYRRVAEYEKANK